MTPPSILLLTTSQAPLAIRFPRPHKPTLNLPVLVHRSLHSALDAIPPSVQTDSTLASVVIPHPDTLVKHDVPIRHRHPSAHSPLGPDDVNAVSQPEASSGQGDELEAETTVKVHLVGAASAETRAEWVRDALEALETLKGLSEVDTLLVGFKGIDYKGKRTAAADFFGCGAEGLTSDVAPTVTEEAARDARAVWELLRQNVDGKKVKEIGTLYLPLNVLRDLSESSRAPKVNSLDTPDCHSLPKEYTGFAKERGIQLWAGGGGEGSDPLPDADLHNLLNEFVAVLPLTKVAGHGANRVNGNATAEESQPLSEPIPLREDGLKYDESAKRGVAVRWVLGYTLVSKSRNVLKDKGYIIAADVLP
ncbi:hypothetical protein DB88DRAFT_478877 [Papiliotrema laurentii]|uniref:GCS light chain n=1 Tax=Papiliotrema laurentii TaxID=5418 RepID=A0AAD9L9Q0_PAPLA|nr:hypothetical protein DB88DRAFT_478877 [Papiliotrema laurentii]